MNIQTFAPEQLPLTFDYITPKQTHSATLIEIKTGQEDLDQCDGIWSRNRQFCLGVKTADCAPITFHNDQIFGVIHAGWRGCINGIIEEMMTLIEQESELGSTKFNIGPILPQFEIQKDHCYQKIQHKFGEKYFISQNGTILFNFKKCLESLVPNAQFDPRSTGENPDLASWRRDQNQKRNLTLINIPN